MAGGATSDAFILTLPSDACMDLFPGNTQANYTTKLPHPIELSGRFEVALLSLIYPHTWPTLANKEETKISLFHGEKEEDRQRVDGYMHRGHYDTSQKLIGEVNRTLRFLLPQDKKRGAAVRFYPIPQRAELIVAQHVGVLFSKTVSEMLGFHKRRLEANTIGANVVDVSKGFNSLFVYSDIVEPNIVGGSKVSLLRVVRPSGRDGETVERTFETPLYYPVAKSTFETIEISLNQDDGTLVPFERGKVHVVLHFRRRKKYALF